MTDCWDRYKHKLSGTFPGIYSPIKPTVGHVVEKSGIYKSGYVRARIWALLNMEEFYYQNSGSLVIQNMDDFEKLNKKLSGNRNVLKWENRLTDYKLLGQGSFGVVFKATDPTTSSIYAVKIIKQGLSNDIDDLFKFIQNLLLERNTLAELNRCPFFVRLIAAYQRESEENQNFVFIMEFCVTDLKQFSQFNRQIIKNDGDLFEYLKDGTLLEKIRGYATSKWKIDYEKLIFIYFFEMLTALHYLATKHVVHADLKPQNVLISQTGHIKIADMGLAFKDQWTYATVQGSLPSDWTKLDKIEQKTDYIGGTFSYFDPEIVYRKLSKKNKPIFQKLQRRYKKTLSKYVLSQIKQTYLSDLFAIGLIMIDLTCGTYDILDNAEKYVDVVFWVVDIVYHSVLRRAFLEENLEKMVESACEKSVIKLILSIFQPRDTRSKLYVTEQINDSPDNPSDKTAKLYIDIHKVENIVYYKKHNINKENVLNFDFQNMANLLAEDVEKLNEGREHIPNKFLKLYPTKTFRINTFDYDDF